ncbi:hypothetical protein HY605_02675 [Candidatus Peregrinibacteria bacterium]|nr:hypothetical protein [Candidatus Peregrinibacteria bacterium]
MSGFFVVLNNASHQVTEAGVDKGDCGMQMGNTVVDVNKDGSPDLLTKCKDVIVINEQFRQVSGHYGIGRKQPAKPEETTKANDTFNAGSLAAMKIYGDFKKALSEGKAYLKEVDIGYGIKRSRVFYVDSTGKERYVELELVDGESNVPARPFGEHITRIRLADDNSQVVIEDSQFLTPIQGQLDTLYKKEWDANQ